MKVYRQVSSLPATRAYVGECDDRWVHWQAVVLVMGLDINNVISGRKVAPTRHNRERYWLLVTYKGVSK